jgi:hypothetical protein
MRINLTSPMWTLLVVLSLSSDVLGQSNRGELAPPTTTSPEYPVLAVSERLACKAYCLIELDKDGAVSIVEIGGVTVRESGPKGEIVSQWISIHPYFLGVIRKTLEERQYPAWLSGKEFVVTFEFRFCEPGRCPEFPARISHNRLTVFAEKPPYEGPQR